MTYLEQILMRQAVAAREQQAASALLARLRERELAASQTQQAVSPLRPQLLEVKTPEAPGDVTQREAEKLADLYDSDFQSSREIQSEKDQLEKIQHSNSPVSRLMRELTALAGETRLFTAPEMGEETIAADNWLRMEQRVRRAVAVPAMPPVQRTERLASEGPRSMEPYGQADAAALSRLYERDARRYDGGFEWGR